MWFKRKWLRVLAMLPLAILLMGGVARVNPKEIEDILHIMNATKVEFALPDKEDDGDGK